MSASPTPSKFDFQSIITPSSTGQLKTKSFSFLSPTPTKLNFQPKAHSIITPPKSVGQPKAKPFSFISPIPKKDKSYYFQHVIFLVEGTLFNVPRHHFEDSPIFSNMFSLPTGHGIPDGTTNDQPLRLDRISRDDFSALLKVICPKHFLHREKLDYPELVSVLKLSTMWEFEDVRKLAIEQLTNIDVDPVSRLELTRMYDVPQWYWMAIRALCEQTKRLEDSDVSRLGVNFSLRIAELRGQIAGYKRALAVGRGAMNSDLTVRLIRELFAEVRDVPLPDAS